MIGWKRIVGYGLPVSTTHVLSCGIAGTMAANGSGLQWSTIRNIALAWVLTLPAAMIISGTLYLLFSSAVCKGHRFDIRQTPAENLFNAARAPQSWRAGRAMI